MKKTFLIVSICALLCPWALRGQNTLLPDSLVATHISGEKLRKQTFVYDKYGNEVSDIFYSWNQSTGSWNEYVRTDYQWDTRGNQTANTMYRLDSASQKMQGISNQVAEYDRNNNETVRIYYRWDNKNNDWKYDAKRLFEYDGNGKKTEEKFSIWNDDADDWSNFEVINEYDYKYEYDALGNILSTIYLRFDEDYYKFEYQYDANGNQTLQTFYRWDEDDERWMQYTKFGHEYNADNWLTATSFYYWNDEMQDWKGHFIHKYEHDSNGNPLKMKEYNWIDKTWRLNETIVYYYSNRAETIVPIPGTISVAVYPNPAGDHVTIAGVPGANVDITASDGRMVLMKKDIGACETIQTSFWMPGVYLAVIQWNGKQITKKIIK